MTRRAVLRFSAMTAVIVSAANADEVTEWNRVLLEALIAPPAVGAPLAQRPAAIVQAAVFDAVNGIERRYTPVHVAAEAPRGASKRAAAVQAAYASLVHLFPGQTAKFDQQRTISLAGIADEWDRDGGESVKRGIEWGQTVADAIWEWRSGDGFATTLPPYLGGTGVGEWQPTPPPMLAGLAPQLARVTPWAIASPSQFRPAGPPSLTSAQYVTDFNETKRMGSAASAERTADQTLYAQFWNSTSPAGFWDPVATSLATQRHFGLSQNARLLALLNMALADAVTGCWDAKYTYSFWRPITAIALAGSDGNDSTAADPNWTPLIVTPPFPEYPSAHSCVSAAAVRILSNFFGEQTPFGVTSDGMAGTVRYFASFADALEEVENARVFGGIHFRTACDDGTTLGSGVGAYILEHALVQVHGENRGNPRRD